MQEQRAALSRHATMIEAAAQRDVAEPEDRDDVERAFGRAMRILD